jgi:hypothetical protein
MVRAKCIFHSLAFQSRARAGSARRHRLREPLGRPAGLPVVPLCHRPRWSRAWSCWSKPSFMSSLDLMPLRRSWRNSLHPLSRFEASGQDEPVPICRPIHLGLSACAGRQGTEQLVPAQRLRNAQVGPRIWPWTGGPWGLRNTSWPLLCSTVAGVQKRARPAHPRWFIRIAPVFWSTLPPCMLRFSGALVP